MELRHIRYFIAVAEELSFTRAAERLHTAQPSLSQQIRDLEDAVGTPLLFRTKRRVELTDAGQVFLSEARLVLAQVERSILEARQAARAEAGELVIGFVPSAEVKVFPRLLPVLRARVPNIRITLHSLSGPELREALRTGKINVAFLRWLDRAEEGIEHQPIFREELMALLPENHPLSKESIVSLKSLVKTPFVGVSAAQAPELRQVVRELCESNGYKLNTVQEADNILMNLTLVGMGVGFGILPDYARDLLIKNIQCRPIEGHPGIDLSVAWTSSSRSAVLRTFLDLLWEVLPKGASQ